MKGLEVKYTVVLGPGSHQKMLIGALKTCGYAFEVFNHFPAFTKEVYNSDGILIHKQTKASLTFVVKVIWAIVTRLKSMKNKNLHFYLEYKLYDLWISLSYSKESKVLWAWSQVSLNTIKKFKKRNLNVILENPMIHVNKWNQILGTEYKKFSPKTYRYYYFHKHLVDRMKDEYRLSDKIVVLSDFVVSTFEESNISLKKLSKVNLYASELVREKQKNKRIEKKNILFVGRIDVLKGIPRLLNVMEQLVITHPDVKLILVGEIKEEAKPFFIKSRPYIELVGVKSAEELATYYFEAQMLILPSVQESFGLVILEALINGTLVLAAENSGAPDIEKHCKNLYLFNSFNENEMLHKITELLEKKFTEENCNLDNFSESNYRNQVKEILMSQLGK